MSRFESWGVLLRPLSKSVSREHLDLCPACLAAALALLSSRPHLAALLTEEGEE